MNMRSIIFKKHVKDCFICAIKPLIYAGFTITYIGRAECPHTSNVDKPRIQQRPAYLLLATVCNSFIVAHVLFVTYKLFKQEQLTVPSKYYYKIILPNYINTLNYTLCFLANTTSHNKYTNGLIALIDKRRFFGIDSILDKKLTGLLQLWSLSCFCFTIMVCVLFLVTTTPKELGLESLLLSASMLVNNINALAFAVYSITTLIIYKALFRACLNGIRNTLHHGDGVALLKRLQHQQQFYIVVCSNYKKHVFGFGNPIFYTGQLVFTVLSVVQAYFFAFEPVDEGEGYWFVFFSKFYHSFLSVMSAVICIEANSIHFMSRDLISFLYKYRINKLSDAEALQVEMLLITLHTEKPVLTASNLFTFGISLLASVSGTAVTYVLVALQFHASL